MNAINTVLKQRAVNKTKSPKTKAKVLVKRVKSKPVNFQASKAKVRAMAK